MLRGAIIFVSTAAVARSQSAGKNNHLLPLPVQRCTKDGGCVVEDMTVTMDANWRWIHEREGYTNCYSASGWSTSLCPDNTACAANCALEGVPESQWSSTYGISRTDAGVRLNFKTGGNIGSRMYVMDTSSTYKLFKLKNREITFDVDVSTLACGLNGAVYFSEMPADGGLSATNTAGAAYGTGYCDAQCPKDIKFFDGKGNSEGWHTTSAGRTFGNHGSCCAEMDLWEANRAATAYTAHPCTLDTSYRCEGEECDAQCDKPGCDFNSYRMGDRSFFGPGEEYALNSLKPFTIVTQFLTADGTDSGDLSEIRRFYMQDGKRINNSKATWEGLRDQTSLSDTACTLDKEVFGEEDTTAQYGGMKQMGEALARGMTLVLSLWDDADSHMLWLDSTQPADASPSTPGAARGPCPVTGGDPRVVRQQHANAWVEYFNVKYGELDSTVNAQSSVPAPQPPAPTPPAPTPPAPTPPAPTPPAPTPPTPAQPATGSCCWGGCGANAWSCSEPSSWCVQSRDHCEGNCGGQWCAAPGLGQVQRHRQLRGEKLRGEHVMLQSFVKHEGDEGEELVSGSMPEDSRSDEL